MMYSLAPWPSSASSSSTQTCLCFDHSRSYSTTSSHYFHNNNSVRPVVVLHGTYPVVDQHHRYPSHPLLPACHTPSPTKRPSRSPQPRRVTLEQRRISPHQPHHITPHHHHHHNRCYHLHSHSITTTTNIDFKFTKLSVSHPPPPSYMPLSPTHPQLDFTNTAYMPLPHQCRA